jgi:PAS domain S-box-containing protein
MAMSSEISTGSITADSPPARSLLGPARRLMHTLSFAQKFLLISCLFVLPLALAVSLYVSEVNLRIVAGEREVDGSRYMVPLHDMLCDVVKCRQVSHEVRSGDQSIRPKLTRIRARITRQVEDLVTVDARHGESFQTRPRPAVIRRNWEILDEVLDDPAYGSDEELHSELLDDVIDLLHHVGDTSGLILDPELDTFYLMNLTTNLLNETKLRMGECQQLLTRLESLPPTEAVNQRARLQSIADQVTQDRLSRERMFRTSFSTRKPTVGQVKLESLLKDLNNRNEQLVAGLLSFAQGDPSAPGANALIDRCTTTLDANAALWTQSRNELDDRLQTRITGLKSQRNILLAVTLLALLLVSFLWLGFYSSIRETVTSLSAATQGMLRGDFGKPLVLSSKDELGQIGRDFSVVANRLRDECRLSQEETSRAKAAETALRAAEEKYRGIVENASDGIFQTSLEGEYLSANPALAAIYGYDSVESLLTSHVLLRNEFYVDPNRRRQFYDELLEHGRIENFESQVRTRDGREIWISESARAVRNEQGDLLYLEGLVQDVTERKLAAERIEAARSAAEEASRFKSEFLANMSHEIRTPMNGIIGMAELLANTRLDPEQKDYLGMVRHSADALLRILNDILDFSKIEAGRLELEEIPFKLRECVGRTAQTMSVRASDRGLELACRIAPDVPDNLIGDPGRLRQVLMNLMGNAVKFTHEGEVAINVEVDAGDDQRVALRLEVRDTGIGIPRDQQQRIFQAFEQADSSTTREFGGTGLGLAIVSQLVRLMHGRVEVESEPGRGSKFTFTCEFGLDSGDHSEPSTLASLQDLPVLVVDDNATNRRIMHEVLSSWRLRPMIVESGDEALAALRAAATRKHPYPLVLLDCMMPGMDGFMLAEQIRRASDFEDPVLIMISSAARTSDNERCRQLRISRCLTKPVVQSDLQETILSALGRVKLEEAAPLPAPMVASLRILLVEDNVINQQVASGFLGQDGHKVTIAGNGQEAVEKVQEQEFDVILMDLQMPVMDGLEAIRWIRGSERESGLHRRIISMTAAAMPADRQRCLDAGADEYVSKPIVRQSLRDAIQKVCERFPSEPQTPSPSSSSRAGIPGRGAGGEGNGQQLDGLTESSSPDNMPDHSRLETPTPVSNDVLNIDVAIDRLPGGRDSLPEFAELLRQDLPRMLGEIRSAVEQQDAVRLKRGAHSLQGSSDVFGAGVVVAHGRQFEDLAEHNDFAAARTELPHLEQAVQHLGAALKTLVNGASEKLS